jgi:hypothetical protein
VIPLFPFFMVFSETIRKFQKLLGSFEKRTEYIYCSHTLMAVRQTEVQLELHGGRKSREGNFRNGMFS